MNGNVPKQIMHLIDSNGLKQCHVAKKAGLKASEFYSILSNRRIIKPCEIQRIAKALNVDVSELFKTSDSD